MDPIEYLRALRRRWVVIAAAVGVALGVAFLTTSVAPVGLGPPVRTYRATTVMLQLSSGPGDENLETVARLTTVGVVPERVAEAIGYDGEPVLLAAKVHGVAEEVAGIVQITSNSRDPEEARTLADTFAQELLAYLGERKAETFALLSEPIQRDLDELSQQIAELDREILENPSQAAILSAKQQAKLITYGSLSEQYEQLRAASIRPSGLQIIQQAVPIAIQETGFRPPQSTSARMVLAVILGLFAGVVLALVVERLDTRVRTKKDAERAFGFPVLAEIPEIPRAQRRSIIAAASSSIYASAFRLLRLTVDVTGRTERNEASNGRRPGGAPQVILVTSTQPGEGKTSVVSNLAASYAESGSEVLVVCCDLRRPAIHRVFGVPDDVGLADFLASSDGGPRLDDHVHATVLPRVSVVAPGSIPENPAELLSSERLRDAIREARRRADVVLLDTPPILVDSDATALLADSDAVLIVARVGRTSAEAAQRAGELLKRLGAAVLGVALTGTERLASGRYPRLGRERPKGLGATENGGPKVGRARVGSGSKSGGQGGA